MIFVECIGINMAFQIPLLTIDWRGVSIMSGVLPIHRVAHLSIYDAYGLIQSYQKYGREYWEGFG
jgi:hypothetical protein